MEKSKLYNGHCNQCGETFSECSCLSEEVKKSVDETTDYSPNPLDRIKNKIAREDGFEDWNEAMYKLGTGSLMLLVDKIIQGYQSQLESLQKEKIQHESHLDQEYRMVCAKLTTSEAKLKELRDERENLQASLLDVAQKSTVRVLDLETDIKEQDEQIEELKRELTIKEDRINSIIKVGKSEMDSMSEQLTASEAKLKDLKEPIALLHRSIIAADPSLLDLIIKDIREQIENLQTLLTK